MMEAAVTADQAAVTGCTHLLLLLAAAIKGILILQHQLQPFLPLFSS